ncbi:MAG TPA: hypothetical protein VHV77_10690 [Pirellulales bacterium]|nr:hypothetical protein [Pirellulales bacterium]
MKRLVCGRWAVLVAVNAAVLCVLGLLQASRAQAPEVNPPFANAVDMQQEMITQLRELNRSVKEQNALLRSGTLHVVVSQLKK